MRRTTLRLTGFTAAAAGAAFMLTVVASAQGPTANPPTKTADRVPASPKRPEAAKAWTPPRTPWGDPDIEGIWPGTDFVGVPMQRPRNLGTRNELTDTEFTARLDAFQRQADEDNADFDIDKLT